MAAKKQIQNSTDSIPNRSTPDKSFNLKQNNLRLILFGTAFLSTYAYNNWDNISIHTILLLVSASLYTALSYVWLKNTKPEKHDQVVEKVGFFDAFCIGLLIGIDGIFLLPTTVLYSMLSFGTLIYSGTQNWMKNNFSFISGIALAYLIYSKNWSFQANMLGTFICLIGALIYYCLHAYYIYRHVRGLTVLQQRMMSEQTLYKLRTYKLARYLTPTVWNAVKDGNEDALHTERKRITVFFSDIAGFSSLSEEMEAETLTELLNTYLTEMSQIVTNHKGTIDKFMGDGIMVLFGDTKSQGLKEDCLRCVAMSIEMRKKMKELQSKWFNQGIKKPLRIRMGINTGFCTVGSFGTNHYMDYTVLGTHVNLASRLESAADEGEILVSHETWSLIKDVIMCRDKGEISAKGFSHPIKVYQVVDFRKHLGNNQSYFEENTDGFSMHMDLEKIKNYDKDRVVEFLQRASRILRDKVI